MPRPKGSGEIQRLTVMTQAEVARALGISTMRVCQLERSALAKLRVAFEHIGLRDYLFEKNKPLLTPRGYWREMSRL
jgi:transcriptional regulator